MLLVVGTELNGIIPQRAYKMAWHYPYFLNNPLSQAHVSLPQVMLESSVYLTLAVYSGCCLLAAVASCFLPIETKGRGLQESSHREWGQEMVGRGTHGTGVTRSNSGSQE